MISIYTDGACSGNPGPGGYGVVVITALPAEGFSPDGNKIIYDKPIVIDYSANLVSDTTNNQMELAAMIKAFEIAERMQKECNIYCDSAYVVNIVNNWIYGWERNGWTRSKGQPIENLYMIKQLYNYLITDFFKSKVKVIKITGHSGHPGNELADALATNNKIKFKRVMRDSGLSTSFEPSLIF